MKSALHRRLDIAADAPVLLVATDYDGTIAPIVTDPAEARPLKPSIAALTKLAELPQTYAAVISGRGLQVLAELSGLPQNVRLVGSHGSEFDVDFASSLPEPLAKLRDRLRHALDRIAARTPGARVEHKPAGACFHYREASESDARRALDEIRLGAAALDGVFQRAGKQVLELTVVDTNKGLAVERLRAQVGASTVVFFGDDLTDEAVFRTLRGQDLGVKVGPGPTSAEFRVDGPEEVMRALAEIAERRERYLRGDDAVPIEKHSLLSDMRTVALVTPRGSIDWFCAPRIDSPALFAELVGGRTAGSFSIEPLNGAAPLSQQYVGDTLVLETRWTDFSLRDLLDVSDDRAWRPAGRTDLLRVLNGRGRVRVRFAPRIDFGRTATQLRVRDQGLELQDVADPIVLFSPGVEWTIEEEGRHQTAYATIELRGDERILELRIGTASVRARASSPGQRMDGTIRHWERWCERLRVPAVAPAAVRRSALLLKALCHGPTGAICAAATTSLPERIGGIRNWDYRYCWLRDAAMSATELARLGATEEALRFLDWMCGVIERCVEPARVHPLYLVTGRELGPEAEIGDLCGYRFSRPVRIGNGASGQVQMDVFGPIAELIAQLAAIEAPLSSEHWRLMCSIVAGVEKRWRHADHGVWEIRKARRHHVHSKVMCWLAVDRAIAVAHGFGEEPRAHWDGLRDAIAHDVLEHGYKPARGAFTAAYDGDDLDAAALHVGLSGLLAPDDPRFAGTVDAVERELRNGPVVYRYRADDGLPGHEGAFHLCTAWLIEAYLLQGRPGDARALFEDMLSLAGPTGLLSEQYLHPEGLALGNVPQAYSHLGVIRTALQLAAANA